MSIILVTIAKNRVLQTNCIISAFSGSNGT